MSALLLTAAVLAMPVPGGQLTDSYQDARDGGARAHEGVDIMAPRGSPVRAVAHGTVAALLTSVRGGLTLYQWDLQKRWVFVYTHLDGYAPGLVKGRLVPRGTLLGFVGTTGDADGKAPHLHFEVGRPVRPGRYWGAMTIDPFPLLGGQRLSAKVPVRTP